MSSWGVNRKLVASPGSGDGKKEAGERAALDPVSFVGRLGSLYLPTIHFAQCGGVVHDNLLQDVLLSPAALFHLEICVASVMSQQERSHAES